MSEVEKEVVEIPKPGQELILEGRKWKVRRVSSDAPEITIRLVQEDE